MFVRKIGLAFPFTTVPLSSFGISLALIHRMDVRQVTIFLFFYLMKQLKELLGNGFIEFRTEFISSWAFLCWEALLWLQSHCYETVQVVDTSWFNIYMSKVSRKLYSSSKFLRFYFNVIFFSDCLYFIGIYNNLIFMLILQILSILLLAGLAKYLSSLFTFSKFNSFLLSVCIVLLLFILIVVLMFIIF